MPEARLRLARAKAAQQAKIDADRRRAAAREREEGLSGRPPVPVEHYVAVRHTEEVLRRAMQRQLAREAVGEQQPPKARLRVNLTDPQSRLMPTRKGWVQGYTCRSG